MTIILGHSNMDADCLGSVLLARYLYPDAVALKSSRMHPLARRLVKLHDDEMGLVRLNEINYSTVNRCIVVDTHAQSQVSEYFRYLPAGIHIHCIDHHSHVIEPILGSLHLRPYGSNCAVLCELLMEKNLQIDPDTATIALAGIYADTGNFVHDNVHPKDFAAAQWLVESGAKVKIVRKMTNRLPDDELMNVYHSLVQSQWHVDIQGLRILVADMVIPEQIAGLALVAERLHEIEQSDATFCIFTITREHSHLIIARSGTSQLDVAHVLAQFGGGGHKQAASALIKKSDDVPMVKILMNTIRTRIGRGQTARELMDPHPPVIYDNWTLHDAELFLKKNKASGAPVLGAEDVLMGILSLADIQKGKKANAMHHPVRAFMSRNLLTVQPDTQARELEQFFLENDITRIPVLQGGNLVGLLLRSTCLRGIHEFI